MTTSPLLADPHERAVVQTLPLFESMRMRAATTARRHPEHGFAAADPGSAMRWVNRFTHTHRRLGPDDREVVSPNNDTVYSNAWIDLSAGPVVIETPDMGDRFWTLGLLDAWTNPFASIGTRTGGNAARRTLLHGPRDAPALPTGVSRAIACPGDDVWLIGRLLVDDDGEDAERVKALQARFAMTRLDGGDAAMRVDTGLDGRDTRVPDVATFRRTIDRALVRNPVPRGEELHWPVADGPLARSLPRVYDALRGDEQPRALGGGWALPVAVRGHWEGDLVTRARVARNLIGALGIEDAMYPTAEVDADGATLDGGHAYELRFPPAGGPRVGAFWSLTLYRRSDCLFVANPIDRYSIGDRTPGLRHEPDGALAIRIQAGDPGPGHNWLPAPAGEPFYVVLRLYSPADAHLSLAFDYPPLRRVAVAAA